MIKDAMLRIPLCVAPTPTGICVYHKENADTLQSLGEHFYKVITEEVTEDYDNGDVTETELLEIAAAFENMALDLRNHLKMEGRRNRRRGI